MPRMRILSASEQTRLKLPPVFNSIDRKRLFEFPQSLLGIASKLRSSTNRIGFLLMCGYFRSARRFFLPKDFHTNDIRYIARTLRLEPKSFRADAYKETTRLRHQRIILGFYGFRSFDRKAETLVGHEIAKMARVHLKPKLIFERCFDYLVQSRIQVPSSFRLSDLIRDGLNNRKEHLASQIDGLLDETTRQALNSLFEQDNDDNRYRLTLLKKQSQSIKLAKIKETSADARLISELFERLSLMLEELDLGPDGIRYFAGSVQRARVFQLQQRTDADRYLHVVAFIAHQHYRSQDRLVDMLLSTVQSFQRAAERDQKDRVFEQRKEHSNRFGQLLEAIDHEVLGALQKIQVLAQDDTLSDSEKVEQIQAVLAAGLHGKVQGLRDEIGESGDDETLYFQCLEARSLRLQTRVNPLLRTLAFNGDRNASSLLDALAHFKAKDGAIGRQVPLDFLDPVERRVVFGEGGNELRPSLYKAFLFLHIANAIKAGKLNLQCSYKYRPLDGYLIDRDRWAVEKEQLLERAGLSSFVDPVPVLKMLDHELYRQYEATNHRAKSGDNPHLRITSNSKFRVQTPAVEEIESELLRDSFPQRHYVPLAEILASVNRHCGLLDEFQHWQQTHVHPSPSPTALLAGVMGLGCGIGVQKMAQISPVISERELENAVNWRFSLDNLVAANDRVVRAMDQMELPNIYRRSSGRLHTSSNGQKFEIRAESLNANYSFKYFGKGRGVSAYTFIDERNLLRYSLVFSASERESAYVIDGLMHNDVVDSDVHSADTHGYNEAIFGITHLLGVSYAPRIANLKKLQLYLFRSRKRQAQDWLIKPSQYVNETTIIENWDDFLRLVVTIKLKEATASDIFRRLNSYSRQHELYRAVKAFGQIIKSIFILRYLDDLELRQTIEKQLNKVELANRFTRAVAVGNPREFIHAEKKQQEIAEACNRLIKIVSFVGITSISRGVSQRQNPMKRADGCYKRSPHIRPSLGAMSTCSASMICPTKNYRIPSEFYPPNYRPESSPNFWRKTAHKKPPSPNSYRSCRGGLRSFMQEHPIIAALKIRTSNLKGRRLSTARAIELIENYGIEGERQASLVAFLGMARPNGHEGHENRRFPGDFRPKRPDQGREGASRGSSQSPQTKAVSGFAQAFTPQVRQVYFVLLPESSGAYLTARLGTYPAHR